MCVFKGQDTFFLNNQLPQQLMYCKLARSFILTDCWCDNWLSDYCFLSAGPSD